MIKQTLLRSVPDIFFQIHGDFFGEYDLDTPFVQDCYLYAVDRVMFVQKYIGEHEIKQPKRRLPDMRHMCFCLHSMKPGEIIFFPQIEEGSYLYSCACKVKPPAKHGKTKCKYCKGTGVSHVPVMLREKNSVRLSAYHVNLLHKNRVHFAQVLGNGSALRFQGEGYTGYILTMATKGPVPAD